jgi:lysophospholipase L1-like esterase
VKNSPHHGLVTYLDLRFRVHRAASPYIITVHLLIAGMLGLALGWILPSEPRIFLIGDSTMADKPSIGNPERGWGQVFPLFFHPGTVVENHARNGRSTKSFINEGRWETVVSRLRPGDYVLIQFGHNDAKKQDPSRYAEAHTGYKANLQKFIRESRSKEAHPILITPVVRRRFDAEGNFYDVHGDYPAVVREVGESEAVPVIDLHRRSMELLKRLGPERSKELFLWVKPRVFSALPDGKQDDTHFCWRGAAEMAALVADELKSQNLPLAQHLNPAGPPPFVGLGKVVLLDCFYNNEWRKDPSGTWVRYHYVWHDTTNSGFSQLGNIITRMGAELDTLGTAPTRAALQAASVYIIVDPDTPLETEVPHFIDDHTVDVLDEWVRRGGTLLLLGNDSGKAEFQQFNRLAERFGIHFNFDSRNRVTGKNFDVGTFRSFPDHPLFEGVRKIFIKELSTLRVGDPAVAVLTDGDDVIMAFARVGEGAVFAVGDPWFYNEYMDERRLPEGYDNARAAQNLFRWLLQRAH